MAEDFNRLKMISKRLVHADFQMPWEFRLLVAGMPQSLAQEIGGVSHFDLLVKDISYGPTTIETEPLKAGSVTLTFPSGTEPTTLTLTLRDFRDRRFSKFFDAWAGKVTNGNGTFNLPYSAKQPDGTTTGGYLRQVKRISLANPDDVTTWWMYPTKQGDVTEALDGTGFLEVPYSMVQFRSIEPDKFENLYPA